MRKLLLVPVVAVICAGCALGPDYRRPDVEAPPAWRVEAQDAQDVADTLWWERFGDPALDDLLAVGQRDAQVLAVAVGHLGDDRGVALDAVVGEHGVRRRHPERRDLVGAEGEGRVRLELAAVAAGEAEPHREVLHRGAEQLPLHVGLGPSEHEHRPAVLVGAAAQLDVAPNEPRVDALADLHRRSPGAVVDEQVAVARDTELVAPEDLHSGEQLVHKLVQDRGQEDEGVLDIAKFAGIAHKMGVPLIVDNTFPTPVNCRPIDFGADIVMHSTSKYMDGHAVALGGAVVDSGRFDWAASGKFPGLTEPDPSYHGTVYTESFGATAYINKLVLQLMRDLGSVPSPFNSFLLGVGLETLALRVERHCANALAVARFLKEHPKVSFVNYPGLPGSKYYALAQQYMPKGTCGVISFGVKGGRQAAVRFMDALKLISIATHVADSKTCVLHPAGTTHRQLSSEELARCGIGEDMVRLSVGIEHIDDLIADLAQALEN